MSRMALGSELERGPAVAVTVDGRPVRAYAGETVATVLIAEGGVATRTTLGGAARGVFCGMGVCFDCLVVIDGRPNVRACMTYAREGMAVDRQDGLAARGA